MVGTRLIGHPQVQEAKLFVENEDHIITSHLPTEWKIKDEWHFFSSNPRGKVNVLLSLDESSYQAAPELKMGGDHPFTWYQYYDGGRSFFTSLGHTTQTYENADFQRMIEGAILWAGGGNLESTVIQNGLILDLDADVAVRTNDKLEVLQWDNQIENFSAQDFRPKDYGLRIKKPGSGRPLLKTENTDLNNHNSIVFREDELINDKEDAFDYLLTGSGYTWLVVLKPYTTTNSEEKTEFGLHRLKDVNSFMGNLKNSGNYEGLWGCLNDDLTVWVGSRNGITFGRFDENNPKIMGTQLQPDQFYVVAARMGSGTDRVLIELFINGNEPIATKQYPVNVFSNPSKLAIGTERDATNHPGSESFDGEIARILIYERPLTNAEMMKNIKLLKSTYAID